MNDHIEMQQEHLLNITPELKSFSNKTRAGLIGTERRQFIARVVSLMGNRGQRRAQNELGWERGTIRKGMKELKTGILCVDNFSGRGRKSSESSYLRCLKILKALSNPFARQIRHSNPPNCIRR